MTSIRSAGVGVVVAFGGGGHGEEGVSEHGQHGRALPGHPAADLVLVQADQALGGLEGLLDPPPLPSDGDQCGQRYRGGAPAPGRW